jgi:hypothetical protein
MFSRISRYRALDDVVTVDAAGRRLSSRELRTPGEVTGRFLHTLADGDRLDQLAATYYGQPRKWWRICDANPELLSPQELLGAEPVLTYRFEVSTTAAVPPWAALLRALNDLAAVSRAVLDGEATILVAINRLNLAVPDVAAVMLARGFVVGRAEQVGRVGRQIVIPPDVTG